MQRWRESAIQTRTILLGPSIITWNGQWSNSSKDAMRLSLMHRQCSNLITGRWPPNNEECDLKVEVIQVLKWANLTAIPQNSTCGHRELQPNKTTTPQNRTSVHGSGAEVGSHFFPAPYIKRIRTLYHSTIAGLFKTKSKNKLKYKK